MKLYRTHAGWYGTQADAKASSKDFETVEVPTDKPGLLVFLNDRHQDAPEPADEFTSVYERQDPPLIEMDAGTGHVLKVDLDALFGAAPLRQQLRLAVTAIDAADATLVSATRPTPALPLETIDAIDDELFS